MRITARAVTQLMRNDAKGPLLLYSASTWLAYAIGQEFYQGNHYAWCTPYFDPNSVPDLDYAVPPSSSPAEIYMGLLDDVRKGDRHSAKIQANKSGILRGVESRLGAGLIDSATARDIASVVDEAETRDFAPLVFVIPFALVQNSLTQVPVSQRAHPLSKEFIIESLPRSCFDVITFRRARDV